MSEDSASTDETKRCDRCDETKPINEFHLRYRDGDERQDWCRSCMAEAKRIWYLNNTEHQKERVKANRLRTTAEHRARAWEYLSTHPCVDCGETDPVVLQFDHVVAKRMNVAHMLMKGWTWPEIEREIANCEVRCGNCHRRKTARDQGIYDRKHSFMKLEEAWVDYRLFDN